MQSRKILYILRHAKAEAGSDGQGDYERALTKRGMEDAERMGDYFARQGITLDRVICSSAVRTRQTWAQIEKHYRGTLPPVDYSDKLYLASANETLNIIARTADSDNHLLIIGHNPGFHQLAQKLAREGDEQMLDALALKFPTCALAVIAQDAHWHSVGYANGRLVAFLTRHEVKIPDSL